MKNQNTKQNTLLGVRFVLAFSIVLGSFLVVGQAQGAISTAYVRTAGSDANCNGTVDVDDSVGVRPNCAWASVAYALTGSRITQGGTLTIQDGFSETPAKFTIALAAGAGATTVRASSTTSVFNNTVTLNIPVGTSGFFITMSTKPINWQNINFANPDAVTGVSFFLESTASNHFTDCSFDGNNAVNYFLYNSSGSTDELLYRCLLKNYSAGLGPIYVGSAAAAPWKITIKSCLSQNAGLLRVGGAGAVGEAYLQNNTAVYLKAPFFRSDALATVKLFATNNIVQTGDVAGNNGYAFRFGETNYLCLGGNCSTAAYPYYDSAVVTFQGNIFHRTSDWGDLASNQYSDNITTDSASAMFFLDVTKNFYLDPLWTDYAGGTFTLQSGSLASQRGVAGSLPGTDITGAAWTGSNDVGCYANPTATASSLPTPTANKVAFIGDSIIHLVELTTPNTFYSNTGTTAPSTYTAIPGTRMNSLPWLVDKAIFVNGVDTVVIAIGVNNLDGTVNPTAITNGQMADVVKDVMSKSDSLGVRPIWIGIESIKGAAGVAPDNTRVIAVNNAVEAYCNTNGWSYDSVLSRMSSFNANWAKKTGGYYNCLCGKEECTSGAVCSPNVHPKSAAQLMRVAENLYLYEPGYVVNDSTGTATATATVYDPITLPGFNNASDVYGGQSGRSIYIGGDYNLTITPINLNTVNQSQKITVNIGTWDNTGTHHKTWTESSSNLGSTEVDHTVGDLEASKYYNVTVGGAISNLEGDDCETVGLNFVCLSNGSDEISFTYTGGYSDKTFDVEEGDNTGPAITDVTSTTSNGSYKAGEAINVRVTFDENAVITEIPRIKLETSNGNKYATYSSGTGTQNIDFVYTVQAGDSTGDLDYVNITSLELNGGTIKDATGNNATLTLPAPGADHSLGGNKALILDTTTPTVSDVTSTTADGSYKAGQTINARVTFSENITITGTPRVKLQTANGNKYATYSGGTGTQNIDFTYTIQAGDTTNDLDYVDTTSLELNGGTLKDAAGNNATLTLPTPSAAHSLADNKNIVIDTTPPTLSFTEDVDAGPVQSDMITATWGDATVEKWKYNDNQTCSTTAGVYPNDGLVSMDQTDQTNNGKYICLYAEDALGNKSTLASSHSINIDITPPVLSIINPTGGTLTNGNTTITFTDDDPNSPQCSIDNSHWTACVSNTTKIQGLTGWNGLSEGDFTLYIKDTDSAVNIGTDSVDLTKDITTPTLSNLSPDNVTLPVTTTSTHLTLATSETATCRYSTNSNEDYASMADFDETDATAHRTFITGLETGTTYAYYVKCADLADNQSDDYTISFSIAPEEDRISLNSIKVKIARETKKFKNKIYSLRKELKLRGNDINLSNGTVEIYKNGNLWKTVLADAAGEWSKTLKFKKDFSGWIGVRQYDEYGTLLGSKNVRVKIDTEDPEFISFPLFGQSVNRGAQIYFEATDNEKIKKYKINLAGYIKNTKTTSYTIPDYIHPGLHVLRIKAYDKAGNSVSKKIYIRVR